MKRLLKNEKVALFNFILLLNLYAFYQLIINLEAIKLIVDINTKIAFPSFGLIKAYSPDFMNLWYFIFKMNWLVLIIYYILVFLSYMIVCHIKGKMKFILLTLVELLMISFLSLKPHYFIPIGLLFNFSLFSLISYNSYLENKKNTHSLILLFFISLIGVILNLIFKFNTLGNHTLFDLLIKDSYLTDIYYIQNISKFILFDSLTLIYFDLLRIAFIISAVYFIVLLLFKYKFTIKKLTSLTISLFIIINLMRIISLQVYNLINYQRDVVPLEGCFVEYMNLGLGENYLTDEKYYFQRCFETTNGVYTVYKEATTSKKNMFDLIGDITYSRIFVIDEKGKEILSVDYSNEIINIYVTTKEDYDHGYNNLIFVEKYLNGDHLVTRDYSFYNLDGVKLLELPDGLPDRSYVKKDLLDYQSINILFKDNKLIYTVVTNQKIEAKYYFFLDGTKELLNEE